ncbi:unnamed protein product [Phaedon cochleariae]|uniref:XPG N-terminal domain-containing protein n=1 Tax=Phaedon cochleariae TaxID=80249 RepID=A0A9N9SCC7_PHACE|nr:unnamed protein product [Phaedon cochleariae]
MGIRGLTTFIQSRSHQYMEKYELHDTDLVIDGNAVACQLYRWHTESNDCFGGDYDKYAYAIQKFFQLLASSNITPLVVFDGGYETKKVATVISRMKNKIKSADSLNGVAEGSISVFPLMLRPVFQEVIIKMGIKTVRCDFEGDTEIASIARILNCPILSYDSDFFIFDVLYIPFATMEMAVKRGKVKGDSLPYTYIPCEVYRVEKFLESFPGLKKSVLPILAVLLGNDYVKRGVFSLFYNNLKIQKCSGSMNEGQKRIKSLLVWLQNENIQTAIHKVLTRYKKRRRWIIMKKIKIAIEGYNCTDSKYLKYLGLTAPNTKPNDSDNKSNQIDVLNLESSPEDDQNSDCDEENSKSDEESPVSDDEEKSHSESDDEVYDHDETLFIDTRKPLNAVIPVFQEKFRTCEYPASFMDILLQNKYYCVPQVEDSALENSHMISFDILSAIHKILTNSEKHLVCFGRVGGSQVRKQNVPICPLNLPNLNEIQILNIDVRKGIFFQILGVQEDLKVNIHEFPDSWQLYIVTLIYLKDKSGISWPLICSLLISKYVLSHIDKKLGVHRCAKAFLKKFSTKSVTSDFNAQNLESTIRGSLNSLSYEDCKSTMNVLIPYFTMDDKTAMNVKSFDRSLVHMISQFQSCLLHIGQLNTLMNSPLPSLLVSECLNCTFVYNMTRNLSKRPNLQEYIRILFQDSPIFLHSFGLIINKLRDFISEDFCADHPKKKRKKRKKIESEVVKEEDPVLDTDEEFVDPSNVFTILSVSQ